MVKARITVLTVYGALASISNAFSLPSLSENLAGRRVAHGPAPGWTYVGCYSDIASSRTLQEMSLVSTQLTPYLCTTFCQGPNSSALTGMNFAGMEYQKECYCDFNIQGTAKKVNDTKCNTPCSGDSGYTCGGAGFVSVYQDKGHNGVLPTSKQKVGSWSFNGCYKDNVNVTKVVKRTLAERFDIKSGVTAESCTTQCASKGFHIAGMEFGQECWCGSSFLIANASAPLGDCSMACKANHTELCGAANRLSVYVL